MTGAKANQAISVNAFLPFESIRQYVEIGIHNSDKTNDTEPWTQKPSFLAPGLIHITSCQRGPGPKPPPAASPTSTTALGLTTASLAGNITSTGGGITTAKAPAPQSGGSIPSFGGGSGSPPGGGGGSGGGGKGRKGPPPDYSTELETELRETLFSGYSRNQRPQKRVIVKVSLNLMSINYLDIKDQSLSTSVYFAMSWFDSRLRWIDNENYTNIPFLFSSENEMWRPAVIIENSVDNIDVMSRPHVPLRVVGNGLVIWTPGGVHVTHCEADITYYPLDMQICHVVLSTWAYTAGEVSLVFDKPPIGLDYFKEHGEWNLIDTEWTEETTMREKWSFSRLKFSIRIRRRPLFHMLNTLFPVILMAFLTVIVFKLPPESGERIGLSLTILLAFAVYLTLISESIPQTSLSASLLSTYLASILLLQTFAVILTVLVLDLYFAPEDRPLPGWLQTIVRVVSCSCCKSRHSPVITPEPEGDYSDFRHSRRNEKSHLSRELTRNDGWVSSATSADVSCDFSWKEAARILDKAFLYLYLFLVCAVTGVCMGIMWGHFASGYE